MSDTQDLQSMIDATLKIHAPYGTRVGRGLAWVDPRCQECETRWPCKTVNTLTAKTTWGVATKGPA
jgi:hypothetical protein